MGGKFVGQIAGNGGHDVGAEKVKVVDSFTEFSVVEDDGTEIELSVGVDEFDGSSVNSSKVVVVGYGWVKGKVVLGTRDVDSVSLWAWVVVKDGDGNVIIGGSVGTGSVWDIVVVSINDVVVRFGGVNEVVGDWELSEVSVCIGSVVVIIEDEMVSGEMLGSVDEGCVGLREVTWNSVVVRFVLGNVVEFDSDVVTVTNSVVVIIRGFIVIVLKVSSVVLKEFWVVEIVSVVVISKGLSVNVIAEELPVVVGSWIMVIVLKLSSVVLKEFWDVGIVSVVVVMSERVSVVVTDGIPKVEVGKEFSSVVVKIGSVLGIVTVEMTEVVDDSTDVDVKVCLTEMFRTYMILFFWMTMIYWFNVF